MIHHEELLWKQKAKCDWLHLGDCNTIFFHTCVIHRKKNNRITTIQNSNGYWIYNPKIIEIKATNFYHNLYGEDLEPMRVYLYTDSLILIFSIVIF